MSKVLVRTGLAALAAFATALAVAAAEPVQAGRQMVVAANPYATQAGIRILRAGGSAVDAAIAVQLVLSLVEPQSSGIGGGAFMLHLDAGRAANAEPASAERIAVYSARETAPASATPEMFLDANGNPRPFLEVGFGGLTVGVPAVMRMFEMAHRDHGKLDWAKLFEPAIELAESGFAISPRLYFLLDRFESVARAERFKAHYYDADGKALVTGHVLVNQDYADTLRLLARNGAEPMYTGSLAREIVDRVNDNVISIGGMTMADLAAYQPERLTALCSPYRQWQVCGPKLPSSGGISVQQILGILEPFDLASHKSDPATAIHLITEASRLAFADRNYYLADPKFVDVPVAALLDGTYLRERSGLIDARRAMGRAAPGEFLPAAAVDYARSKLSELTSTSHFSIVDRDGHAVSMTTSVQGAFGSQLMVGGFILNNQLTDFSDEPAIDGFPVANRAEAGKRPLSSMSPTIVLDSEGRLRMLIGSPGGTRIINYVAQAIVSVLDWELNIQDAVAAPHFLSRGGPIEIEEGTELDQYADALSALGHSVIPRNLNSGLHGITVEYDGSGFRLAGGVDPRREGLALGD